MHQLNTKIATLEEKLNNMSMSSSDKEELDKVENDVAKKDEVKREVLPKSQIWSDHPESRGGTPSPTHLPSPSLEGRTKDFHSCYMI